LGDDHDPTDRSAAFDRVIERERLPLGVIYTREGPAFEESLLPYKDGDLTPLFRRDLKVDALVDLVESLRGN
jgi:2-oxoglutarate ferredoxin oxidoreductase subunit beta